MPLGPINFDRYRVCRRELRKELFVFILLVADDVTLKTEYNK